MLALCISLYETCLLFCGKRVSRRISARQHRPCQQLWWRHWLHQQCGPCRQQGADFWVETNSDAFPLKAATVRGLSVYGYSVLVTASALWPLQVELAARGDRVPETLRVPLPVAGPQGALGTVLERSRR